MPATAAELNGSDWDALRGIEIVVLGEVHDNPHHHANQASAVAALTPRAIVFEQITPALADALTSEIRADRDALEAALAWEERGWPDFDAYFPIFQAAPDAVVVGGGVPIEDVRRAVGEGAAAVFGDRAGEFSLDRTYPEEVQASLENLQQEAHCNALPVEMLPGMVEAQRLRDAALARAAWDALSEIRTAEGAAPVVVITGNGHAANQWGVPSLLSGQPGDIAVVSVGQFEEVAPEEPDFDYWIVTPGVERPDPCAQFR